MTFKSDIKSVFENAIKVGRLSRDENTSNYVGNYMYMGTDSQGKDLFKNSITRQYLA